MRTKMPVGGVPKKTPPITALAAALTGASPLSSMTAGLHPGDGEPCLLSVESTRFKETLLFFWK